MPTDVKIFLLGAVFIRTSFSKCLFPSKMPTFFQGTFKNFKSWELQQETTCGFSDISYGGLKSLELKLLLFCRRRLKRSNDYVLFFLFVCLFVFYVTKGIGWIYHLPALSCKNIRDVGDSKGDGEYWIDPAKNGKPFKVYCDMTTDGGLLSRRK